MNDPTAPRGRLGPGYVGYMALSALVGAVALGSAAAWAGPDFQVESRFGGNGDGATPVAGLIKVDAKLYGVTLYGGQPGAGTIFAFDPTTGVRSTAYQFKGGGDGSGPSGTLIKLGTKLYGTTGVGGLHDCGTVFSFDPTTSIERVLHSFNCAPDGSVPFAGLTDVDGELYGTTIIGGANGGGTIFTVDPATGVEAVVYSFLGFSDSLQPEGQLIYVDGKLYGTTENGGRGKSPCSNGCGTIFSFDPATGVETLVHIFQDSDGATPLAGLIEVDGELYGTTASSEGSADCPAGCGLVYALDPNSGVVNVVYQFEGGADGVEPFGELVRVNDKLYGTTYSGGTRNFGVVFSVDIATGTEKVQHSFKGGRRGLYPTSTLTGVNGRLYGTTTDGCRGNCSTYGTIFSIKR